MIRRLLWIDDYRDPMTNDWLNFSPIGRDVDVHWVINQTEFEDWIMINGLPDAICFDHDLGTGNGDGYECAKWLCRYCDTNEKKLPKYAIQSSNPVGRENIDCYLKNYIKHCN